MLTNAQFYADSHIGRLYGVSDSFSGHHSGVDINGWSQGTRIPAFTSGVVARRGSTSNFGNWVSVRFGSLYAHYCHLRDLSTAPFNGELVSVGDDSGPLGDTGYSFGPHLHAMVSASSNPEDYQGVRDPMPYIVASRGGGGSGGGGTTTTERRRRTAWLG